MGRSCARSLPTKRAAWNLSRSQPVEHGVDEVAAKRPPSGRLAALDLDDYDAIVLCGGQSPMLTFRDDAGFIEAVGV